MCTDCAGNGATRWRFHGGNFGPSMSIMRATSAEERLRALAMRPLETVPDRPRAAARQPILVEDNTCWRIRSAERADLLIDGARYFAALRRALEGAQRS